MTHLRLSTVIILLLGVSIMGCRWLINFYSFFPDRTDLPPADSLPAGVEEVFFATPDGETLQCYWIRPPQARRALIYFHGNAGNISHRMQDLLALADMNMAVLGVSYRGYGRSTGKPSEKGIYQDGRAALDYVTETHGFKVEKVILLGRSIGSAVAVDLAQNKHLAAVILVTPMSTGKAMGKFHGFGILSALAGDAFNNLHKIDHLRCPLLVVHGTLDKIVPFHMGEQLFARAPSPKQFRAIQGAGHNDISMPGTPFADPYWQAIRHWLQSF